MSALDVNDNSAVYYQGNYWNNLQCTIDLLNSRVSGVPSVPGNVSRVCDRTVPNA